MKTSKFQCILLVLILVNLAIFAYFVNNNQSWPKGNSGQENIGEGFIPLEDQELQGVIEDVAKVVTIVIYDFEHFENDVVGTVKSILAFHPHISIIVVSDESPYPPLAFPNKNVKLVVLNVPPNLPASEGKPESFITTPYTLFIPDGFHLRDVSGLKRMIQSLVSASEPLKIIAFGAQGQIQKAPSCEGLDFDYRRWTLRYHGHKHISANGIDTCDSIGGNVAILMQTVDIHQLTTVFLRPFLTGLFVQTVLRNWKVRLLEEQSPFFQGKQLFSTEHNRWKHEKNQNRHKKELFRKFGVKRVISKEGSDEWHGCSKETPRCFGTIINDVASFIYKGRWTPPCCLRNLRDTTKHVLTVFEFYKVPYWLEGGSLLGAARNGDIIPWDYDVDIGMYKKDIIQIPNLKKAKEGEKVVDEDGFVWEKSREGDFYRVQFSMVNHMHVDIFPFYEKNGIMTKDTWFKTHRQDTEFPAKYLRPLERIKFVGMNVLVPNNHKEFLEFKFGKGVIENPKYPNSQKV